MTPEEALNALDSTNPERVIEAIETLGRTKYAPAIQKLAAMLDNPNADLRIIVLVIKSLGEIGNEDALKILKIYLFTGTTQLTQLAKHDSNTVDRLQRSHLVQEAVKRAMRTIGTPDALNALALWEKTLKGQR